MDADLFNVGLEARTRVLGEEYVARAVRVDRQLQPRVPADRHRVLLGWRVGPVGADRPPAQPEQPLPAGRAEPARGVQDPLPRRARATAARSTSSATRSSRSRCTPGCPPASRRSVSPGRCSTPRASRRSRCRDAAPSSASSASATWVGRWRRASPPPGSTLVGFDAAGTAERLPPGATAAASVARHRRPGRHRAAQPPRRPRHAGRRRRHRDGDRPPAHHRRRPLHGRPGRRHGGRVDARRRRQSPTSTDRSRAARPAPRPAPISLMFAGPDAVLEAHRPIFEAFAGNDLPRRDERRARVRP